MDTETSQGNLQSRIAAKLKIAEAREANPEELAEIKSRNKAEEEIGRAQYQGEQRTERQAQTGRVQEILTEKYEKERPDQLQAKKIRNDVTYGTFTGNTWSDRVKNKG